MKASPASLCNKKDNSIIHYVTTKANIKGVSSVKTYTVPKTSIWAFQKISASSKERLKESGNQYRIWSRFCQGDNKRESRERGDFFTFDSHRHVGDWGKLWLTEVDCWPIAGDGKKDGEISWLPRERERRKEMDSGIGSNTETQCLTRTNTRSNLIFSLIGSNLTLIMIFNFGYYDIFLLFY